MLASSFLRVSAFSSVIRLVHQKASCEERSEEVALLCKEAFERFPFGAILSKPAPIDLNKIDYDKDFSYFYFTPGIEKRSALIRSEMCTGNVTAKKEFHHYRPIFADDIRVITEYSNGKIYSFCEPWEPRGRPGSIPFVYARKTAMASAGRSYMLGYFELIDDFIQDKIKTCFIPYDPLGQLPPSGAVTVPNRWFSDAFQAFPNGMAIVPAHAKSSDNPILSNNQWKIYGVPISVLEQAFEQLPHSNPNETAVLCKVSFNGSSYDLGKYEIRNAAGERFSIIMLRQTMLSSANPIYQNGKLVHN